MSPILFALTTGVMEDSGYELLSNVYTLALILPHLLILENREQR